MKYLTILLSLFMTSFAHSLSCMHSDILHTFDTYDESEDIYYLVQGEFTEVLHEEEINRREPDIPKEYPMPPEYKMLIKFTGSSIAHTTTLDQPLKDIEIIVNVGCMAHWCGGKPQLNENIITFFKQEGDGTLSYNTNACPFETFYNVDDKTIDTLRECFQGKCKTNKKNPLIHSPR